MSPKMREKFQHHHRLSPVEYKKIWRECIFIFDTNTLLNIYRYNSETRSDFFKILSKLKGRFWVPYQVVKEFYRNRIEVITEQKKKFSELDDSINSALRVLRDGKFSKSAFLRIDEIEAAMRPGIDAARRLLDEQKGNHPDLILQDPYLEELVTIVDDNIGEEPTNVTLDANYVLAEDRITKQIPPGYLDSKKTVPNKYGDVLIWLELLEYATAKKQPIVLITDDDKDDWWQKVEGKKLGPRPELREEMQRVAGVEFYIYNPSYLLENAQKELQIPVSRNSIEDANSVSFELNAAAQSESTISSAVAARPSIIIPSNKSSIIWMRQFGSIAEQAVLHWLPQQFPNGRITLASERGFLDFLVETDSNLVGVEVKTFRNYAPMLIRSRLKDINLRAFHLIAKNEIDDFIPVLVFQSESEARQMSLIFESIVHGDPYYPPSVGFVNSLGIFEKTN